MSTWKQACEAGSYWIGVAMTVACFGLVLAGNTEPIWRFEHAGFPLSWIFGGAAVVAFLAAEFFPSTPPLSIEAEGRGALPAAEWEPAEF